MTSLRTVDAVQEGPVTASRVVGLLRERYAGDACITLEEVRDAAGFSASRSCDAISLGTWPSRGLTLRGFEVKVSRSDWKREMADPLKAETFAPFFDEWWIAAGSSKVVQLDELPETWGLLVTKGNRLDCVKPATKNPSPTPIDRGLLVALLKRAVEQGPIAKALAKAHADGIAEGKRAVERETRSRSADDKAWDRLVALEDKLSAFQDASGIEVGTFTYGGDPVKLGRAVRAVLDGQTNPIRHRAGYVISELERVVADLKRVRDLPDVVLEPPPATTPEKASLEPEIGA